MTNATKQELFARLTKVQNQKKNWGRDIMTFAGFMSTIEELEAYVLQHEKEAA